MTDLDADWQAALEAEARAFADLRRLCAEIADAMAPLLRIGGPPDGNYALVELTAALDRRYPQRIAQAETIRARRPAPHPRRKLPPWLVKAVMERDQYRCQHCRAWTDLTVDHVVPRSQGGSDDPENLQVLCGPCNSRKGTGPDLLRSPR